MGSLTTSELTDIFLSRPFKTRNADEFDLENILDLFVDPTNGLNRPFDFTNSIIKGKMGSGKTMYLRANYAYHLYTLVPCLNEGSQIILPVYIKLSDFQNIRQSEDIYNAILIKLLKEIVGVIRHLKSAEELSRLHMGVVALNDTWSIDEDLNEIVDVLKLLTAEQYVENIKKSIEASGTATHTFFNLFTKFGREIQTQIKQDTKPSFEMITKACEKLLDPFDGKLLILFDEIGSTCKSFFKGTDEADSYFETLMNQLRTLSNVRTKLAVYPNSESDILRETRYGDVILLEYDIVNHPEQYDAYAITIASLVERYINKQEKKDILPEDVFEVSAQNQQIYEHLVNATSGNMRRLVHLLDLSMNEAYKNNNGYSRVSEHDVLCALEKQGSEMLDLYRPDEIEFISALAKLCKKRSTYRFSYPNKTSTIIKYTNRSQEYNIINILQAGTGRSKSTYYFDYAYCIYQELPTHYIKGTERIDKSRSRITGEPIHRIAQLSDELILQSNLPGKIDGKIGYISSPIESGFINGEDGKDYLFLVKDIIKDDRKKKLYIGKSVRFMPSFLMGKNPLATEIEIL